MKIYSIGQMANLTGVTAKTLRHYEKMNLINPSYDPDNGYRRYKNDDVIKLEMVLTLKLLGFELGQISEFINNDFAIDLMSLALQKKALNKKITEMKNVIALINSIPAHQNLKRVDLNDIVKIIKELKMQNKNIDWYLEQTEEDMRKLGTGYPSNKLEEDELKEIWNSLLSQATKLKEAFKEDQFNQLADQWLELIYKCVGNDREAIDGLLAMYAEMHDWPEERQLFDPSLGEFMGPLLLEYHASRYSNE